MYTDNGNQTCQNEKTPTEREERSSVVCAAFFLFSFFFISLFLSSGLKYKIIMAHYN